MTISFYDSLNTFKNFPKFSLQMLVEITFRFKVRIPKEKILVPQWNRTGCLVT